MNIKEIEQATGLPRANIRFYEEKKLIDPLRGENGYRIYEPAHVEELKRIQLLRSLDFSIEEIRSLQTGGRTMDSLLEEKEIHWVKEKKAAESAAETCRSMRADGVCYHTLDAEQYRQKLPPVREMNLPFRHDRFHYPFVPARRFFARMLDYELVVLLWTFVLAAVFHVLHLGQSPLLNVLGEVISIPVGIFGGFQGIWHAALYAAFNLPMVGFSSVPYLLTLLATVLLTILLEPLFLHFFGTTPGKWIMGLKILEKDGRRLSLQVARERTKKMFWQGEGAFLPVLQWVRRWKRFSECVDGKMSDWDYECNTDYILKDENPYRWFVFTAVLLAVLFSEVLCLDISTMPPNRGELTVAQFAENYNFVLDYLNYDGLRMSTDGKWVEKSDGAVVIRVGEETYPEPWFETDERGIVMAVGFDEKLENGSKSISGRKTLAYLLSYTTAVSQPKAHLFSFARMRLEKCIPRIHPDENYDRSILGIHAVYEYSGDGYVSFSDTDAIFSGKDENRAEFHFSVTIEPKEKQ